MSKYFKYNDSDIWEYKKSVSLLVLLDILVRTVFPTAPDSEKRVVAFVAVCAHSVHLHTFTPYTIYYRRESWKIKHHPQIATTRKSASPRPHVSSSIITNFRYMLPAPKSQTQTKRRNKKVKKQQHMSAWRAASKVNLARSLVPLTHFIRGQSRPKSLHIERARAPSSTCSNYRCVDCDCSTKT